MASLSKKGKREAGASIYSSHGPLKRLDREWGMQRTHDTSNRCLCEAGVAEGKEHIDKWKTA